MDEDAVRSAIAQQLIPLTEVADGTRTCAEANDSYLRQHAQLVRVTENNAECFCPWGNVIAWWNFAATLGKPGWREYLASDRLSTRSPGCKLYGSAFRIPMAWTRTLICPETRLIRASSRVSRDTTGRMALGIGVEI